MSADRRYYQLTCPKCSAANVLGPDQLLARLRAAGMLRRQKEPPMEMIEQLLETAVAQFRCDACGHVGLRHQLAEDAWEDDGWEQGRACQVCGKPIPAERIELFPDAERCVACQRREESGDTQEPTYCPRCGSVMVTRLRRGVGIAGYEMHCPACKR